MPRKLSRVIGSVLVFFLLSGPLIAQAEMPFSHLHGGGRMRGGSPGFMFPLVILKKLDLTSAQKSRVREIMAAHRDTLRSLFERLEKEHDQLATKFFAPGSLTAEDLTSQTQSLSQLREALMNEGVKAALEIRKVLTSEQLGEAARLQNKMREMRAEMRQLLEDDD